jgi:hypothetical protein
MASARTYFDRDMARGRAAAQRCREAGGTETDAVMAQFDATFSPTVRHSTFKARVSDMMKRGAGDPRVIFRFRGLAERCGNVTIHYAIGMVEGERRLEINQRAAEMLLWGRCSRPMTRLMLLNELRLILRWLARYAPERFAALRDAVRKD